MKVHPVSVSIAAALFSLILVSCSLEGNGLNGRWKLIPEKSGSIDPWSDLTIDIRADGNHVTVVKRYAGGNKQDRRIDSMTVNTLGKEEIFSLPPGRWLGQVSMGIYHGVETRRRVVARISGSPNELHLEMRETLETAQGEISVQVREIYSLSPDGSGLGLTVTRSTRKSGPPLAYAFARVTP